MRSWLFNEQAYHPAWREVPGDTKIAIRSRDVDPVIASDLLNRFLDEWMLADELGLDIMVNEHHASTTCMAVSCMMTLAALARQTSRARLLTLGIPSLNRMDPFRIAEEIAYVDTLSRGRLEFGLIKGSDWEMIISNASPARSSDRYWESHDLVKAALTHTSGPFSWEGENFQYRYVNVIPRCYQQPLPPMWMPTFSPYSTREIAKRDYTVATFINGRAGKAIFQAYRDEYLKFHGREASLSKFAYLGLVAVGPDQATGRARGFKVAEHVFNSDRLDQKYRNPPGYRPVAENARMLKQSAPSSILWKHPLPDGRLMSANPSVEDLIMANMLFAGTPDQVYDQIKDFWEHVGGFGNLLVQMGGTLEADEAADSIRLFAKEVHPRLVELVEGQRRAA